ncbi:hypothetical protein FGU71_07075 [Erythrobacter insulae]|uniref:asparagine synthase (glutamine-hydrolyzing) n=1 Tax=Erythrobacter insulae TaxID=2584124 RepID=A0A547PBY8_9SPHN|nr:asparagine synthase-related protein [Erythrobacter insulae]TRD11650.1 hypothetical protein FGU71_07075 [Erythrobacter insulae]
MTGIAAVLCDGPGPQKTVQAMSAVLEQTPHDSAGDWADGAMALSACALATTAESLGIVQPCTSLSSDIALVFDGFLTNHAELRRDLLERGAILRNRSDEELVLCAYEEWGDECAIRIEGEFAFVIADLRRQILFCARDHQGLRPLYYFDDGTIFAAGSSIAAVLAALPGTPQCDYEFLAEAMIAEVHSIERTGWKDVRRLKAAHCLSRPLSGKFREFRYYSLPERPITKFRSDADYIAHYRDVLSDAIRRTSRTHLPLAIEVSGGLDSSAVYCLAQSMIAQGGIEAPSIAAYSLRGEEGGASDEIQFARAVADFTDTKLYESELFRPPLEWFAAEAAQARDLPTYTNAAHSIHMEQLIASSGARVVLNGMGGDQWLDGSYGYYHQAIRARAPARFIENLRRDIGLYGVRSAVPFAIRKLMLSALPDPLRLALKRSRPDYARLHYEGVQFLNDEFAEKVRAAKRRYLADLPVDEVHTANVRTLDSLPNQRAFDLMYRQRANIGLEGRSPMFTRQFIEFCCSVPEDLKFRGGRTKWLHREAMRGLMPDCVTDREDKASFPERKHDASIRSLCEKAAGEELAPIIDAKRFTAFCALREGENIDDSWGRPYWGAYSVAQFLKNISYIPTTKG